jgi:hypothetical protein
MKAIALMFATETAIAFAWVYRCDPVADSSSREQSVLLKLAIAFLEAAEMRSLCGLFGGRSHCLGLGLAITFT